MAQTPQSNKFLNNYVYILLILPLQRKLICILKTAVTLCFLKGERYVYIMVHFILLPIISAFSWAMTLMGISCILYVVLGVL